MKYNSIQYLRAIAAAGVVLNHASTSLLKNDAELIPFTAGGGGVDLFFVISGFVMYYTTARDDVALGRFYLRRIIRIAPIYFLLTTVAYLMAVYFPAYTQTFTANFWDYVRSILFIPYINEINHLMRPEIGQGWTLNYEMFFYLVFGLTLLTTARVRLYLCLAIFSTLSILGMVLRPENVILATYTDTLTLEFTYGIAIAFFVTQRPDRLMALLGAFVLGTLATFAWVLTPAAGLPDPDAIRFLTYGMPAAAIVCLAIILERQGRVPTLSWLLPIGDASYSLYLTHTFALAVLRRIFQAIADVQLLTTHVTFMVVSLVLSTVAALFFYRIVESPITDALMSRVRKRESKVRNRENVAEAI